MILAFKNGMLSSCTLVKEDDEKYVVKQHCNKSNTVVMKDDDRKKLFDSVDAAIS